MTIVVSKKILGKGSFATVFEGTQGETRIAVKRIEIERCDATEIRREEENLKKLNHPNVIRLLDAWSDDLFKYYALELCEASIEQIFLDDDDDKKYKGPILSLEDIIMQLALGLDYIHDKKMIHRDLKPENALIWTNSRQGDGASQVLIKWSDFGLSKTVTESGTFLMSGLKGTLRWCAPEILEIIAASSRRNSTTEWPRGTIQSDVFSEGLTFGFIILKGQHPYGNNIEVVHNLSKNNPVNLTQSNIPYPLMTILDVIYKMLESNPAKRPTAKEVVQLLRRSQFVEHFVKNSVVIKEGKPNLCLLNVRDNSISSDIRLFDIGQHNQKDKRDHKVIILMGATDSGKSTLIEGMVNFILGVQWKDSFRFKCVREDEDESRNKAHSLTSSVTAYTIHHQEGMAVPYSITIIDTPGYGDTRGVARDREITKKIQQFLMQKDSRIDEIHAACFVAASGDSRLTVTQRYVLDSVLSIFGKDFRENIRLLVTFADNATPPVVEACRVARIPMTSPSEGITYSKFNSSVLYVSNRGEEDSFFDELFWDMGQENFQKFFKMLERMNGKDLKSTRQVIQQRQLLQKSLRCIESELEVYCAKIENIAIFLNQISANDFTKKMNQNSVFEKTEILFDKVNCDIGFMAFNCIKCRKTCEETVRLDGAGNMKNTKSCEMPTCKCPIEDHVYADFVWKIVPVKVKTTLKAMKAEYMSNNRTESNTREEIVARCLEEQSQVKGKLIVLLQQVGATGRFLDSTALRSNALSPTDYLSLMRSRVAEDQAPGYLTRLETLTELQQLITEIEKKSSDRFGVSYEDEESAMPHTWSINDYCFESNKRDKEKTSNGCCRGVCNLM